MNKPSNPFITVGYVSKDYFCDREHELKHLLRNVENDINTTIISARRFGKSALIYRFFEELEQKKDHICIFTDMYASQSLKDFTETLALAVFKKFPEKKGFGKRFFDFLKGFRPMITYDVLTGQPEVHFEFVRPKDCEQTLKGILSLLDEQQTNIVLAIDEFQQVANYPEENAEALLRTIIQTLKNTRFVFSGSNRHLMTEIFNTAKRPFFSSTQMIGLTAIHHKKYKDFIHNKFEERKREIDDDAVDFILSWTLLHTYYTQIICKNVFARKEKRITVDIVKQVCEEQLNLQHITYIQYRNLLSPVQWQLLIAIAKEGKLYTPQAKDFLLKYKIGAASSAKKALNALLEKEMIYAANEENTIFYRVYDVFLLRWLDRTF